MKASVRNGVVAFAILLALFAGWRVVGQMQAERYAATDPERALRWRPGHPQALLALAERRLQQGDPAGAEALARRLLAREPTHGVAFRVLAEAAERQGRGEDAFRLYRIAERRAPRDLKTRAWLTQRYLEQGEYAQALEQVDRLLRMSPRSAGSLNPVLVQLAEDPAFAKALAAVLHRNPRWRPGMLAALRDRRTGNVVANGLVLQELHERGGLGDEEYAQWLDSLIAAGQWGEAYARWAGSATRTGGKLPFVYNGDFAWQPSNSGFDWRTRRVAGVMLQFEPAPGASGNTAYLRFLDRRVATAGLEQPLMLPPGRYRLSLRMRAQSLRSQAGLQWRLSCAGKGGLLARTEPVDGSFGWREFEEGFSVPASGCPGQWLRLVNPVAGNAAQRVAGELWIDDVRIFSQK